jgi:hypothetical protein
MAMAKDGIIALLDYKSILRANKLIESELSSNHPIRILLLGPTETTTTTAMTILSAVMVIMITITLIHFVVASR